MRRLALLLTLLVAFAAAILIAVAVDNSTSTTVIHARNVATSDFNAAVRDFDSLVSQYTK